VAVHCAGRSQAVHAPGGAGAAARALLSGLRPGDGGLSDHDVAAIDLFLLRAEKVCGGDYDDGDEGVKADVQQPYNICYNTLNISNLVLYQMQERKRVVGEKPFEATTSIT
jgi:hypothetical protein